METECIVNLKDLVRLVSKDQQFPPAVYETWIARHYTKSWGVPCVSVSLLEAEYHNFGSMCRVINETVSRERIKVLDYLPRPNQYWNSDRGIWLLFDRGYLLMGDGHAVKKYWRHMHY